MVALCAVGVCAGGRRRGGPGTGGGVNRVALDLSSAVCVGWRLIELPALLLLVYEAGLKPERDGAASALHGLLVPWRRLQR